MKDIPRIITGVLLILLGLGLVFTILLGGDNYIVLSGLSLISLIIGIVILSNKKENKIEEIRKK
jgi:membrane-bound ClpP family serine protease